MQAAIILVTMQLKYLQNCTNHKNDDKLIEVNEEAMQQAFIVICKPNRDERIG